MLEETFKKGKTFVKTFIQTQREREREVVDVWRKRDNDSGTNYGPSGYLEKVLKKVKFYHRKLDF